MTLTLEYFGNKNIDLRLKIVGIIWIIILSLSLFLMFVYPYYVEIPQSFKNSIELIGVFSILFVFPYMFFLQFYGPFTHFKGNQYKVYKTKDFYSVSGVLKGIDYDNSILELKDIIQKLQMEFDVQYWKGRPFRPYRKYSNACLIESNELAFEIGKGNHGRTYLTIHVANKEAYEKIKSYFKFEKMGVKDKCILAIKA